eukprot:511179_1
MSGVCASCGKTASLLCSWCKSVNYCNKKCQKLNWKQHKKKCKWSVNKNKNGNKTPSPSPPHFIQTAPGVWHHPRRKPMTKIQHYRKIAAYEANCPSEPQNESGIIININSNILSILLEYLPSTINGQRLRKGIISFNAGPLQIIPSQSLPIIINKSVKHWINIGDTIIKTICSFHYNYESLSAAHLIIGLISEYKPNNRLVCRYLQHAKSFPSDEDINLDYSEELFESKKRLSLKNIQTFIDEKIFEKLRNKFDNLVNYMVSNFCDCYVMVNHITDDMCYFRDMYVFMVGVNSEGGLGGILLNFYDPEGDVL